MGTTPVDTRSTCTALEAKAEGVDTRSTCTELKLNAAGAAKLTLDTRPTCTMLEAVHSSASFEGCGR